MTRKPYDILRFWDELKRRKVVKSSLVYIAVAFGILQAADIIFPRLGLPDWTVTFVIILLVIVFILVIVLTWVYDITPHGIEVTQTAEPDIHEVPDGDQPESKSAEGSEKIIDAGADEAGLKQKVIDLEPELREADRHFGRSLLAKSARKLIFPVVLVLAVLLLVFNKQAIIRALGFENAAREVAREHNNMAALYINAGDYEAARKEAELALDSDPGYSYAWGNMAVITYRQGDRDKAIVQTIKAITLDPSNSYAPYNIALALQDKKDFEQAKRWYREAIRIDSTSGRDSVYTAAASALGNLYNSMNQPIDAIIVLSRAMDRYPESKYEYLVYRNLGNAYMLQAQVDSSIKYLELSDRLKPLEAETTLLLAKAYEAAKDLPKCIETWKSYIGLEQDSSKAAEAGRHLKEITKAYLQELSK
jgi:tetratricopeptide (TPR) repeat protein